MKYIKLFMLMVACCLISCGGGEDDGGGTISGGTFEISEAISIDEINYTKLVSIKDALTNYASIKVDDNLGRKVKNGMVLEFDTKEDYILVLDKDDNLLAIYQRYKKDVTKMKPYCVFRSE